MKIGAIERAELVDKIALYLKHHPEERNLQIIARAVGYTNKLHSLSKIINREKLFTKDAVLLSNPLVSGETKLIKRDVNDSLRSCIPGDFGTYPLATRIEWLGNELLSFAVALSEMRDEVVRLKKLEALARAFAEQNGGVKL